MAGETEVKAQIKMRLLANGVPMVVIRSFQLAQKKSALQFKAIDQVRIAVLGTRGKVFRGTPAKRAQPMRRAKMPSALEQGDNVE